MPESLPLEGLSAEEVQFLREYLKDRDGERAARACGHRNPKAKAKKFLDAAKHPALARAIQDASVQLRTEWKPTAEAVLNELAKVAFFNPKKLLRPGDGAAIELKDLPDEVAVCIKKIKVSFRSAVDEEGNRTQVKVAEIEPWDKLAALRMLAEHFGLIGAGQGGGNDPNKAPPPAIEWDKLFRPRAFLGERPDPVEIKILEAEAVADAAEAARGEAVQEDDETLRRLDGHGKNGNGRGNGHAH